MEEGLFSLQVVSLTQIKG